MDLAALHRILLRSGEEGPEIGQWVVAAAFKFLLDDEAQETGEALAVGEVGVGQHTIQLKLDTGLFFLRVAGASVCRHVGEAR